MQFLATPLLKPEITFLKSLSIEVLTNKTLLKPEFKLYLNPLLVRVRDLQKLYIDEEKRSKYQPLMVKFDFFKKNEWIETTRMAHEETVNIGYEHVYPVGLMRQIDLKEYLESNEITFEIHDRDEIKWNTIKEAVEYLELKEPEPIEEEELDPKKKKKGAPPAKKAPEPKKDDKKDPKKKKEKKKECSFEDFQFEERHELDQKEYAVAKFFVRDFLNPYALKYELTAQLTPFKIFIDEERENLTLNATARKKERELVR